MRCLLPLGMSLAALFSSVTLLATAKIHPRWNQAGYAPLTAPSFVLGSEENLEGLTFTLVTEGRAPLSGRVGAEIPDKRHTPFRHTHVVATPAALPEGRYQFILGERPLFEFRVASDPYGPWRERPLLHLQRLRSGSDAALGRGFSHPGDAKAWLSHPVGSWEEGRWARDPAGLTVDVLGGWYDAGDQIKFTLNHAYVVYHLLLAYELGPDFFPTRAPSGLPQLIDEARHGLQFLLKVHPDPDTFIIQVGDALDHQQAPRLPENDPLDGQRPALAALARPTMAGTVAALAKGALIFEKLGRKEEAATYRAKAEAIWVRLQGPGILPTAFERDKVNDFYRDTSEGDQMALAAAALYALAPSEALRETAERWLPGPGTEVSWASWHGVANASWSSFLPRARADWVTETTRYRTNSLGQGQPWGLPTPYTWASLHRWIGAANLTAYPVNPYESDTRLLQPIIDYTFGRNNWGVSFLFAEDLPNTVRNIYGPVAELLGTFPDGALSEGPGNRSTHDALAPYFKVDPNDPLRNFNTEAAVFYDSQYDFMCQEATIVGQAEAILMFALARYAEVHSKP